MYSAQHKDTESADMLSVYCVGFEVIYMSQQQKALHC